MLEVSDLRIAVRQKGWKKELMYVKSGKGGCRRSDFH